MSGPVNRRELLLAARDAFAQVDDDEAIVAQALELEQIAVESYGAALAGGTRASPLAPRMLEALRRLQRQEREHVEVLESALDALGGRAPRPPAGLAELERARGAAGLDHPLAHLRTEAEVGRFAIELENAQMARYLAAVRGLRDGRLVATAMQVLGAEGQHATVVRGLLSDDVALIVPTAFERGESPFP